MCPSCTRPRLTPSLDSKARMLCSSLSVMMRSCSRHPITENFHFSKSVTFYYSTGLDLPAFANPVHPVQINTPLNISDK